MKKRTQILAFLAALTLCAATPVSAFAETEDITDATNTEASEEVSDTEESSEEESSDTEEGSDTEETDPTEESSDTEETDPSEEASDTEETDPTEESSDTEETDPSEEASDTEETDPTEEATERLVGDVTGDGLADSDDAVVLLNVYADTLLERDSHYSQMAREAGMEICDVNKDGVVDADDAAPVLKFGALAVLYGQENISMEEIVSNGTYSIYYPGNVDYESMNDWVEDEVKTGEIS